MIHLSKCLFYTLIINKMYATNTLVDRADYTLTAGIFVKILSGPLRQR